MALPPRIQPDDPPPALDLTDEELDALEACFRGAAKHLPPLAGLRGLVDELPPLAVGVAKGAPHVMREATAGWFPAAATTYEALREAAQSVLLDADQHMAVETAARRALDALALRDLEASGLDVVRWVRVVEVVDDPTTERTLDEARALLSDPEIAIGDELGLTLPDASTRLTRHLLFALRAARPLDVTPAPDASARVERALAEEAARTGLSEHAIARGLEAELHLPSPHDYAREVRLVVDDQGALTRVRAIDAVEAEAAPDPNTNACLAAEVDRPPGTVVGFDRGAVVATGIAPAVERAIVAWGWQHEGETPTSLSSLLPMDPELVPALVRRFREAAPIALVRGVRGTARCFDDYHVAKRFARLEPSAQLQALRAAGERLSEEPTWRTTLAEMLRIAQSHGDPSPLVEAVDTLIETGTSDRANLLLYLGDLATRHRGVRFSDRFCQDPLGIDAVTGAIAQLEDDEIDRLLGPP